MVEALSGNSCDLIASIPIFYCSYFLQKGLIGMEDYNRGEGYFASQEQETSSANKYGRLAQKKPLISKDSGRAFFDSADWALCKQGGGTYQKSTATVETLRPKLERTPQRQLPPRRPACTSGQDSFVSGSNHALCVVVS